MHENVKARSSRSTSPFALMKCAASTTQLPQMTSPKALTTAQGQPAILRHYPRNYWKDVSMQLIQKVKIPQQCYLDREDESTKHAVPARDDLLRCCPRIRWCLRCTVTECNEIQVPYFARTLGSTNIPSPILPYPNSGEATTNSSYV